jgi:hypothetical protein
LLIKSDPTIPKDFEKDRGLVRDVVILRMSAGAAADVSERSKSLTDAGAKMSRNCRGRRCQREHHFRQIIARMEQTLSNEGARTKHRLFRRACFEATKGGFGDEFVAPGQRHNQVEAKRPAGVRQLDWPRRQCFDYCVRTDH